MDNFILNMFRDVEKAPEKYWKMDKNKLKISVKTEFGWEIQ